MGHTIPQTARPVICVISEIIAQVLDAILTYFSCHIHPEIEQTIPVFQFCGCCCLIYQTPTEISKNYYSYSNIPVMAASQFKQLQYLNFLRQESFIYTLGNKVNLKRKLAKYILLCLKQLLCFESGVRFC